MRPFSYAFLLPLLLLASAAPAGAQSHPAARQPALAAVPPEADPTLEFIPNRGQWPGAVRYAAAVPGGHLLLEGSGLRYVLLEPIGHPHEAANQAARPGAPAVLPPAPLPDGTTPVRGHQLRMRFVGADTSTALEPARASGERRSYLHGADPKRWAAAVPGFRQVRYQAPWPGIGARFYENATQRLEYDFEVSAGADPGRVRLRYEGASSLTLSADGQLHVGTSLPGTELTELAPHAYQLDPATGQRQPVACRYRLRPASASTSNPAPTFITNAADARAAAEAAAGPAYEVSFELGRYDRRWPLVIDPTVIFSTYSGARGSNWGFTATYDAAGNLYSGGIVLDDMQALPSYPTTAGAFQTTFAGVIDIAIIKYNTSVSGPAARLWATYIGGNRADFPSSLDVTDQGELVVLGSTSSTNYPTTAGAVQRGFAGGIPVDPFGDEGPGVFRVNGTDIVVSRLSADGTTLRASTYLGGAGNDGVAAYVSTSGARQLPQNYGDAFRGDLAIDATGNVFVASVTGSPDFPTTAGSFGPGYRGGTCDAVLVKLSPDLDRLVWSGTLGGAAADAAYSVQLDRQGRVYVAGGTLSTGLAGTGGGLQPTWQGSVDGFVARVAADGRAVERATYLGTGAYDQAYFVQLASDGGVYVLGQTLGPWPVSAGVYSNPGSRQFIVELSPDLDQRLLSTVVGSGRPTIDISPTAFLVDECDRVYISGWGGNTNGRVYSTGFQNDNGFTHDMPTTANAVRRTPDTPGAGSDFYLAQYSAGLRDLTYGTFYGDPTLNSTGDHVDGGTSRFDPRGVVYAAVCSCFNLNGFPVPPGANTYATTNGSIGGGNSSLCNNAAFKLNFETTTATVGPSQTVCANAGPLPLTGASPAGGTWSGPGVSGSVAAGFVFTPSAALAGSQTLTYQVPGVVPRCAASAQLSITVNAPVVATAAALAPICANAGPLPLTGASPAGGTWSGPGVSGSVAAGFAFTPTLALVGPQTLTYTPPAVAACATGGTPATTTITVLFASAVTVPPDATVCANAGPLPLTGSPAGGTWSGAGVSGSAAAGFVFTPSAALVGTQTLTYLLAIVPACATSGQFRMTVNAPVVPTLTSFAPVCAATGPLPLTGASPAGGTWSGPGVSGSVAAGFAFTPTLMLVGPQTLTYTPAAVAGCPTTPATTTITVLFAVPLALPPDSVLCPGSGGTTVRLRASVAGGFWAGPGLNAGGTTFTLPAAPGTYALTYTVNAGTSCPVVATRRYTLLADPALVARAAPVPCPLAGAAPDNVAPYPIQFSTTTAPPAGATLSWDFGDGSPVAVGASVAHAYAAGGTFSPVLTVRLGPAPCPRAYALAPIKVREPLVPNVITPNGDTQNDFFKPRLGGCPPRLQVFSRWGRLVFEDPAYRGTWGAAGLAGGLYYYLLTFGDDTPAIKGWVEVVRE